MGRGLQQNRPQRKQLPQLLHLQNRPRHPGNPHPRGGRPGGAVQRRHLRRRHSRHAGRQGDAGNDNGDVQEVPHSHGLCRRLHQDSRRKTRPRRRPRTPQLRKIHKKEGDFIALLEAVIQAAASQ